MECPPRKELEFYRERAREMLKLAEKAPDDSLRTSYLHLAASWDNLAAQMEHPGR